MLEIKLSYLYITSYSMNATETTLLHFYLISMFVLRGECHVYIKEVSLSLDLFVIVVKLCTCSTCHGTFISLDINRY